MDATLSIGEFSRMTYLSVKALRHYHDVGLLEPASVDPVTGYRQYTPAQVATAQAIRRFRDLDMPIDGVRRVLAAPDEATRNRVILAHLERMQAQLEQTQAAVSSLQSLLGGRPHPLGEVTIRRLPPTTVLADSATVAFDDCAAWLEPALTGLHDAASTCGATITGADGALYHDEFFHEGAGEVTAFVPVTATYLLTSELLTIELPATTVAVLCFEGPFSELDQAYGALGTVVAKRGIAGPGPIREHYLTPASTEVCWPVTPGANA